MRKSALILFMTLLIGTIGFSQYLDDFNGNKLDSRWTVRDPMGNGEYEVKDGKLLLDLKAGSDLYIQGTDGGVMFLMDPPDDLDEYTVQMLVNPAVLGFQPPACQIGIIFFREDEWAYSLWGPYANTDIRVEDCIGGNYRWRDGTLVGIDQTDVRIDQDVYIMTKIKVGESIEFFAANDGLENWVSGGTDTLLPPHFEKGTYKVGIFAKSWGGSIDSSFEFDFFNIPEIAPVQAEGKLATTWAAVKR